MVFFTYSCTMQLVEIYMFQMLYCICIFLIVLQLFLANFFFFLTKCEYLIGQLGAVLLPERLLVAPQLLQVAPQHLQHHSHSQTVSTIKERCQRDFQPLILHDWAPPRPLPSNWFLEFHFQVVCYTCLYRGVTYPSIIDAWAGSRYTSKRWSKLYLAVSRFSRPVTLIAHCQCASYLLYTTVYKVA